MKILWVFPSFEIGGAQRRFATLAGGLGADFSHRIVSMDGCYGAGGLIAYDVDWARTEVAVEKSRFFSSVNIKRFRSLLENEAPDVLVTHNWGAIEWRLANRKLKFPHLHIEDGFSANETPGGAEKRRDLARQLLFTRIASGHEKFAFVAPSEALLKIYQRRWRVDRSRIHLIYNGVDINSFSPQQERSSSKLVIGSVGALRREKRFDRLLRIFAAVRSNLAAKLLIVGDGVQRDSLEQLARELQIAQDVEFVGAQTKVAPFLSQMDIYALTSDTEQMPISLIEAMATALPVVASNVGDVASMLSSENSGLVHDLNNEETLALSLLQLAKDKEKRAAIGGANRSKARASYSHERMIEAYRSLFASLTSPA
ncbi:MAG: glycosyltransferase family 4 protein [Pseudomonadota bacterium]